MGKMTNPMSPQQLAAIGGRLRELIDESGLRQQDVAIRAGIGVRTLGWYLSGRDIPSGTLIRIADAMEMEPSALMREIAAASRTAVGPPT